MWLNNTYFGLSSKFFSNSENDPKRIPGVEQIFLNLGVKEVNKHFINSASDVPKLTNGWPMTGFTGYLWLRFLVCPCHTDCIDGCVGCQNPVCFCNVSKTFKTVTKKSFLIKNEEFSAAGS